MQPLPNLRWPRVGDLMRRRYVTVAPDHPLEALTELMRFARVRHLPVVSDGILVGLVSYRDVIEVAFERVLGALHPAKPPADPVAAAQLVRGTTQTAQPHERLDEAAARMLALRIGCLPVVEPTEVGPKLVGLLTESDLLRAAYAPSAAPPA